jgi:beta-lactamase class A
MAHDSANEYRNWTTPRAMIHLLQLLQEGRDLKSASRALLLHLMTDTPITPHRIKGLLPPGTQVAHKSGTSGARNGLAIATNDTAIVTLPDGRHLLLAIFVSDSKAGETTRDAVIAQIARAAWDHAVK